MSNRSLGLGVLLVWCTGVTPALAADDASRAAARRMATAGVEAFQHDDYAVAIDKLDRAYKMLPVPSIGLWLARALAKQGRLVEAAERYTEVGRLSVTSGDAAVQKTAQKDAATELDALTPRIPSVVVRVEGAKPSDVKLTLDGADLSSEVVGEQQPVDPGRHRVEGKANGQIVGVDVSIAQSENKTLTLRFKPESAATAAAATPSTPPAAGAAAPSTAPATVATTPSPPSDAAPAPEPSHEGGSSRKILGWSVLGLGAAGLVTGAVAGSLAISKKGELDDSGECVDRSCRSSTMQGTLDSYATMRTVSSIGLIAGGALAATGIVLVLTAPSAHSDSALAGAWVRVGTSGVTAGGRF